MRNRHGLTLMEVLLVLAIVAISAALIWPRWRSHWRIIACTRRRTKCAPSGARPASRRCVPAAPTPFATRWAAIATTPSRTRGRT